jgi:hypothetical protein
MDKMSINIGETFVFTLSDNKQSLEMGSLSSIKNTGGINLPSAVKNTPKVQHQVMCYPNPVKDELTFSVSNAEKHSIEVTIFDLLGKVMVQTRTYSPELTKLDVSGLKPGQYIMELKTIDNLEIPSLKFIKL